MARRYVFDTYQGPLITFVLKRAVDILVMYLKLLYSCNLNKEAQEINESL